MRNRFIILIILMVVLLISCQNTTEETNQPKVSVSETTEIANNDINIFCSSAMIEEFSNDKITFDSKISFKDVSELELNGHSSVSTDKNSSAELKKTLKFNEKELVLEYSNTTRTHFGTSQNQEYHKFGYIDNYSVIDNEGSGCAEFNSETGKLTFFMYNQDNYPDFGNFTIEQAQNKATEFIHSIYGEDSLDGYVLTTAKQLSLNDKNYIKICFVKHVLGYRTTDLVFVHFDMNGEIVAFNANTFGTFDFATKEINVENIDNAKLALNSVLQNEYKSDYIREIRIDAKTGKCYLYYAGTDNNQFYVNIN